MTNTREERVANARQSIPLVSGYAVLREAMFAKTADSETWPRLSPAEARGITTALRDAEALLEPSPDVWEAIETAPTEGPVLLWAAPEIFVSDKRASDGTWWDGDWDWRIPATHWAMLPDPPKVTVEEDRA